jgi:hypothetical protein
MSTSLNGKAGLKITNQILGSNPRVDGLIIINDYNQC